MADRFPHLNDSDFPDVSSVDVYKYANSFDYTRYDAAQMKLQLCTVPWDVGEVRVGQAIVPGLGNVVYFDSKSARDAYFTAMPDTSCYRFETKFKELHRENKIDVPIPFDVAVKYNYLVVDYNLFANDDSLVMYEDDSGLRKWFYFIREVEFIAPNSTKLHLILDAWQTFIYDLDVSGMMLERGHAPLAAMTADAYLQSPINANALLLHPDINNDNASYIGNSAGEVIFNPSGSCYCIIITTADPRGTWGTKAGDTWATPAPVWNLQDGSPSWYAYCIKSISQVSTHFTNINTNIPQFAQTIKAVFFINSSFVTLGTQFTFAGATCNLIATKEIETTILTLSKNSFGFAEDYKNLAKLYTYPYSYIELYDENGDITEIRIETMDDDDLKVIARLNIISDFIRIISYIESTGKGEKKTITYQIASGKNIKVKGNWYKLLKEWNVPTFGIVQSGAKEFDYSTHFNRKQSAYAADNSYTSSTASSANAKANAELSADTTRDNAFDAADISALNTVNNANLATDNAATQNAANTANNTADKTRMNGDVAADNAAALMTEQAANTAINGTTNSSIQAENQRAALAASSAVVTGGVSAVTSALTGNIAGAVGALVGAGTQAANATMNAAISAELSSAHAAVQVTNNTSMRTLTQLVNNTKNTTQQTLMDAALQTSNDLNTDLAAASAATLLDNAANSLALVEGGTLPDSTVLEGTAVRDRLTARTIAANDKTTADANALRTKNTAYEAIDNQIAQAALNAPYEFGNFTNVGTTNVLPYGLFASIVTQDDYSIAYAGDEFLRHGYYYNRSWPFDGNWNVSRCKYFTYWKLKDIWTSNINIPDMYVDRIRYLLLGGVTVWRSPEYIGHKTIYENMDWS